MELTAIGAWAGDKGPYLFVIGVLATLLWRMMNRFFAQQDAVVETLLTARRATNAAVEAEVDP